MKIGPIQLKNTFFDRVLFLARLRRHCCLFHIQAFDVPTAVQSVKTPVRHLSSPSLNFSYRMSHAALRIRLCHSAYAWTHHFREKHHVFLHSPHRDRRFCLVTVKHFHRFVGSRYAGTTVVSAEQAKKLAEGGPQSSTLGSRGVCRIACQRREKRALLRKKRESRGLRRFSRFFRCLQAAK